MAKYPIPAYQAKARSGEPVKESDNGAIALAARSVLDWRVSEGQFFCCSGMLETAPVFDHVVVPWVYVIPLLTVFRRA
jgi:hypothetical protein